MPHNAVIRTFAAVATLTTLTACPAPVTTSSQSSGATPEQPVAQPATSSDLPALAGGPGAAPPSALVASGAPALAADPAGRSPLLVPAGWTVAISTQGQVTLLRIDETPGQSDSPTLGLLSQPLATGATAETMLQMVTANVQNGRVLTAEQIAPGVSFYLIEGVLDGIAAKLATVGATDGTLAYATFFVAPAARFDSLGGAQLLAAAMGLGGNTTMGAPTGGVGAGGPTGPVAPAGDVDVASYQVQVDLLANRRPMPPESIVGKWSQGAGAPMGNVYEETTTGTLSYDAIGHGNLFEFKPDGSYAYVHNYSQTYYSCRNFIRSGETGSYSFDGSTLTLRPASYQAQVCSCCAGNPTTKQSQSPPPRQYEVAFAPQGSAGARPQQMVIRGTCPEYIISCVGEPKYQREGFYRH